MVNSCYWTRLLVCILLCIANTRVRAQDTVPTSIVKENSNSESTAPLTAKKESMPEVTGKKDKPAVIVVANKIENPTNWNSWTPVAPPTNASNWIPNVFSSKFSNPVSHESVASSSPTQKSHYSKGVQKIKKPNGMDKWGIADIRSRVMEYGKMLFSQFMTGMVTGAEGHETMAKTTNSEDNEGSFDGSTLGNDAGRGLVSWISRLIGVDGKSLGEFLREYQVHVLYDLIFTFFKWIFFLYAGLLIP